jgi:hypothetical protein
MTYAYRHKRVSRSAAPVAPVITSAAALLGVPQEASVASYTSSVATGSPAPTRTRQWTLDGVAIGGATAATYTPITAHVGHALRAVDTWTNSSGSAVSTSTPIYVAASTSFVMQDIGLTGWTPYPTPTTSDYPTNAYKSAAQTGSRIYYINPSLPYSLVADAAALYYLWNGAAIIDNLGNLAPTSGPYNGVAYGTDPFNPAASVTEFTRWAYVAPRIGGDIGYTGTTAIAQHNSGSSAFRFGKPDYWLIKRGTTMSFYRDMRTFLDDTGRSATNVPAYATLITAGGVSPTQRAVIGPYGPLSVARPIIKDQMGNGFLALNNNANYQYVSTLDLTFDGSARNVQLSPVDFTNFPANDHNCRFGINFAGLQTPYFVDNLIEGCHFHKINGNCQIQWATTNSTNPEGLNMRRNIFNDSWFEGDYGFSGYCQVGALKTGADQTWTGTAVTQVTYASTIVNAVYSNVAGWNTGTSVYSTQNANRNYKGWFHLKFTGTVTGNIQVAMYVNGVQGQTVTIAGTGVTNDVYNLHDILYSGNVVAAGTPIDLRINVTAGSGTYTLTGSSAGAFIISQPVTGPSSGCNGLYMFFGNSGARYRLTENIFIRSGFAVDPNVQATPVPNGLLGWDWNIFNHNQYFVGNADGNNCFETGNLSLLGPSGDTRRNAAIISNNFTYQGYAQMTPEHNRNPFTVATGAWTDNVHQNYRALAGSVSGHPAIGITIGDGIFGAQVSRNIVTEAGMGGSVSDAALTFSGGVAPYAMPGHIYWQNGMTDLVVSGNLLEATYATTAYALTERNGATQLFSQWQTPTNIDWLGTGHSYVLGDTVTVSIAGSYTGTPAYQWYRYDPSAFTKTAIAGATSATYTLAVAGDLTGVKPSVACAVTGIVMATGTGISATGSGNQIIQSVNAGTTFPRYYIQDVNGGTGTAVYPIAPAASGSAYTATSFYANRAAQTTAQGGYNANVCFSSILTSLGVTVTTAEAMQEYRDLVVGGTDANIVNAMRRGKFDARLLGPFMNNQFRAARGMATL